MWLCTEFKVPGLLSINMSTLFLDFRLATTVCVVFDLANIFAFLPFPSFPTWVFATILLDFYTAPFYCFEVILLLNWRTGRWKLTLVHWLSSLRAPRVWKDLRKCLLRIVQNKNSKFMFSFPPSRPHRGFHLTICKLLSFPNSGYSEKSYR
jgi:hypothetical protein